MLKRREVSSLHFSIALCLPFYALFLYVRTQFTKRERKYENNDSAVLSQFTKTVLESEKELFKECDNTMGWQSVQLYRTFVINLINTFVVNPIYRTFVYGPVFLLFGHHDAARMPYKNCNLNFMQKASSSCLFLIVACNGLASTSYLFSMSGVSYINEMVMICSIAEIVLLVLLPRHYLSTFCGQDCLKECQRKISNYIFVRHK